MSGETSSKTAVASACETASRDEVVACDQCAEVATYLDGELDASAARNFEQHLSVCILCRAHLDDQRRVLAALEGAFGMSSSMCVIELPESYARVVAARAKADVATVRTPRERRHALGLCVGLSFATFVVLGVAASAKVYEYVGAVARTLASLARLGAEAAGDLLAGASVLFRAAGEGVPAGLRVAPIVLCALFFLALALLLRLIASYRRAEFQHVQCEFRCD